EGDLLRRLGSGRVVALEEGRAGAEEDALRRVRPTVRARRLDRRDGLLDRRLVVEGDAPHVEGGVEAGPVGHLAVDAVPVHVPVAAEVAVVEVGDDVPDLRGGDARAEGDRV